MLLGGNLSSGNTSKIIDSSVQCSVVKAQQIAYTDSCCSTTVQKQPVARYPSMVILGKTCTPPTPAEFAKYPKVAIASSVRTRSLASGSSCPPVNPVTRFAHYQRYQVPVPCPPLPASANMAGISLPSSRECNL